MQKKLLDYAVNICKQSGTPSIRLDIEKNNKPMREFILNNGFKHCGTVRLKKQWRERSLRKIDLKLCVNTVFLFYFYICLTHIRNKYTIIHPGGFLWKR